MTGIKTGKPITGETMLRRMDTNRGSGGATSAYDPRSWFRHGLSRRATRTHHLSAE